MRIKSPSGSVVAADAGGAFVRTLVILDYLVCASHISRKYSKNIAVFDAAPMKGALRVARNV
jgi:hypothetical protein